MHGLARHRFFYVYAVACTPPTKKDWQHLQKAVDACSPAFYAQVARYQHLPALLLGRWALYAWTGKRRPFDHARGFIRDEPLRTPPDDKDGSGKAAQAAVDDVEPAGLGDAGPG